MTWAPASTAMPLIQSHSISTTTDAERAVGGLEVGAHADVDAEAGQPSTQIEVATTAPAGARPRAPPGR